jgi:hypothetical protein
LRVHQLFEKRRDREPTRRSESTTEIFPPLPSIPFGQGLCKETILRIARADKLRNPVRLAKDAAFRPSRPPISDVFQLRDRFVQRRRAGAAQSVRGIVRASCDQVNRIRFEYNALCKKDGPNPLAGRGRSLRLFGRMGDDPRPLTSDARRSDCISIFRDVTASTKRLS